MKEEVTVRSNLVRSVFDSLKEELGDRVVRFDIGGSVSKGTDVRGLSDVDVLVTIGNEYSDMTPAEAKRAFKRVLAAKFPGYRFKIGDMAITMYNSHEEIQILPVFRTGSKVRMPNADGKTWSPPTDQDLFRNELDKLRRRYGKDYVKNSHMRMNVYKVDKIIRIMKIMESMKPRRYQLTGYYLENIVFEALRHGNPKDTSKNLLKRCYEYAADRVKTPMREISGQSRYVDAQLGPRMNGNRQMASESFAEVAA